MFRRLTLACLTIGMVVGTGHLGVAADAPPVTPATFEGTTIDLAESWGEAGACAITPTGNRCYRSETEMDLAELVLDSARLVGRLLGVTPLAACSSSVRLYPNTAFGGTVASFTTQGSWINLSAHGIDNTTSSYRIGACNATFKDGISGTGSTYPGATTATSSSSSMSSGWDNAVSSLFIS